MSPAHVLEPTYERLKSALLSGTWAQLEKLEAQRLADDFGVSMTPVRDCLNRLVGEGLVDFKPGEGYRVPQITERAFRDMLDLNLLLVNTAAASVASSSLPKPQKPRRAVYAARVNEVFHELAEWSGNSILCSSVSALNDRLSLARRVELTLFSEAPEEIERIAALASDRSSELKSAIASFHELRRTSAAEIIHLIESWRPNRSF